ncbi:hypothetical protein [Pseudonocardia sp. GCM10023141]|uniref:ATP-dependent DNA ligase n=1 Tax=Pseudonocardia sp. GCM10023141 TaxID=3252653 RepID=UPI003619FAD0
MHRNGRLDFAALQRRIHPAAMHAARRGVVPAATLVLFDLLATRTRDLRHRPYRERRDRLERLLADTRPPLALMPTTCDVAAAVPWLTEHLSQGVEGVVINISTTATCRGGDRGRKSELERHPRPWSVACSAPSPRPHALLLGLCDEWGHLRVAGRTAPLPPAARRDVGAALSPPSGLHPWPGTVSSSRWGQLPPERVSYPPAVSTTRLCRRSRAVGSRAPALPPPRRRGRSTGGHSAPGVRAARARPIRHAQQL